VDGDDLAELGVDAEEIAKLEAIYGAERSAASAEYFAVFPENWEAVRAFCAMETQWRELLGPMGQRVRTGLDYPSIAPVLSGLGVKKRRRGQVFMDLRVMERAVLEEMAR
jgi:hypothetical protein